ncbi:MAG: GNAT family N-acetyltransferase [bacterium]
MFSCKINSDINLRILETRHAEQLFSLTDCNRAYLREWLPWLDSTKSVEDTLAFIRSALQQFALNNGFQAGIWYQEKLAGAIGFHCIDWPNLATSLGYWLAKNLQGNGIVTQSCQALLNHAFFELKLHRVEIRCAVENSKSRRIPERLGFKNEGTVRGAERLYEKYVDNVIYGMLADEWAAAKNRC